MNNNYIPLILKEKILSYLRYLGGLFYFALSFLTAIALFTFDINDNSFLTKTDIASNNFLGIFGSYYASFILYTFGIFAYLLVIFFLVFSILTLLRKSPDYIFIRLIIFFISLIIMPQSLIFYFTEISLIEGINSWGIFAQNIFDSFSSGIISYILSSLGLLLFLLSQNILTLIKLPKLSLRSFFKNNEKTDISVSKKDPIINNSLALDNNLEVEKTELQDNENFHEYTSPSLDILESNGVSSKQRQDSNNIKTNSDLLENVFSDFNIEIKVINVKLGPVVTLFEILPAAGIKINTIINLADDISRSMGVGAVRIAQIYGTQYLGVEVPNEQRETVTIKELLSNDNFKNTSSKIPICIGKDISGNIEVILNPP